MEKIILDSRYVLLIAATLMTAIAGYEAGYLRDLKDKIIELRNDKTRKITREQWLRMRKMYRALWKGFTLFSIASLFTFLAFLVFSIILACCNQAERGLSIFWSIIGFILSVGWIYLMSVAISFHDYRDPGRLRYYRKV